MMRGLSQMPTATLRSRTSNQMTSLAAKLENASPVTITFFLFHSSYFNQTSIGRARSQQSVFINLMTPVDVGKPRYICSSPWTVHSLPTEQSVDASVTFAGEPHA